MTTARTLKSALLAEAAFLTAGCSLFDTLESDSSGSVTFRIDGATASKIAGAASARSAARSLSAEDVSTGSTTEGVYFDIALKGGYTAIQTLPVTDGATATFDDIPVGTTLWAEGIAYRIEEIDGNQTKIVLYTGKSDRVTIKDGENALSLVMKKAESEEPDTPASETYTITFVLNGGAWASDYTAPATYTSGTALVLPDAASLTRTGYGFAGWFTSADGGETLGETALSEISTETTGNITLYAKWTEGAVNYTVRHLHQNIDDDGYTEVTADTQTLTGTTGEQTAAVAKPYTGFTAKEIAQAEIAADGTTAVEIKYDRNTHTETYADGVENAEISVPSEATYRYGATVMLNFVDIGERTFYKVSGLNNGAKTYSSADTSSFIMGDSDVTLTAVWTADFDGVSKDDIMAKESSMTAETVAADYTNLLGRLILYKTSSGNYGVMQFYDVDSINFYWKTWLTNSPSKEDKTYFSTGWGFDLDGGESPDEEKDFGLDENGSVYKLQAYNNAKFYVVE